jgi:cytidine deaminase
MRIEIVSIEVEMYSSIEELSAKDQVLLEEARNALSKSYSPYSAFEVGAALILENGLILSNANFENASFPLALCAERTALAAANAHHPGMPVIAMAITAHNRRKKITKPIPPCGACRQVLSEIEDLQGQPIRLILQNSMEGEILVSHSCKALLPFSFDHSFLK